MLLKDWIDIFVEGRSTGRRMFLKSQTDEDRKEHRDSKPDFAPKHENAIVEETKVQGGKQSPAAS